MKTLVFIVETTGKFDIPEQFENAASTLSNHEKVVNAKVASQIDVGGELISASTSVSCPFEHSTSLIKSTTLAFKYP